MKKFNTTGESRALILQSIEGIINGTISNEQGKAIAANMSVLNTSMQTEINHAKVAILAKEKGIDFGKVVRFGSLIIDGANE